MTTWTEEEANAAALAIAQRARTDPEFRQLCLTDPTAAVKAQTDKDLPDGFLVRFVDNRGANLTLVLPDFAADGELSDRELEDVAGGKCGVTCGGTGACAIDTHSCAVTCGGSGVL